MGEIGEVLSSLGNDEIMDREEADVNFQTENPETPKKAAKVIVYTPSREWVPAEDEDEDTFFTAKTELKTTDEDDVSVFSMDLDYDADELKNMAVPRTRSKSRGQDTEPLYDGLPPFRGRSRKRSSSPRRRSISVVRDSKGRFSRSVSRPTKASDDTPILPPKKRRSSSVASRPASTQKIVRDSHGRFSSARSKTEEVTSATLSTKRRSSSKSDKNSLSADIKPLVRDSKERFSQSSDRSRAGIVETPILPPQRKYSLSSSGNNSMKGKAQELIRDEHGRFAKKVKVDEVDPEYKPSKKASRSDALAKALGEAAVEAEQARDSDPSPKPKKNKKKATQPTSSPYFSAPTTPSRQTEDANGELSTRKTPKRSASKLSRSILIDDDDEDTPSSQTSSKTRSPGGLVSCIPFPPLDAENFGLIQEKLAHDPFRLLIAVTFLIRTHGKHAIPVFYTLMSKYPTPESLFVADKEDIVPIIRHLGLQNQRASTYQMYAKIWLENKPEKGKRYAVRGYPDRDSGRDVKKDEVLDDDDDREAWEIGHMTQGPYALDSWRIFCRDELRGLAKDWMGTGAKQPFQPEWMRVLPEDKELRAYLRWMWLKEGFEWDPFTGEKQVASRELVKAAMEGRIAWDGFGGMRILDQPVGLLPNLLQVGNLGDDLLADNSEDSK